MRVIVANRFATVAGGAEKHAVALARLLRSHGHETLLLSTADDGNADRQGAFVPPSGADFWRGQPPLLQRAEVAATSLWNRRAAAATEALVTRFQPDLLHLHDIYPQLSVAPVVVAARRGVPIVQTLHNYELMSASPVDHRGRLLDHGDAPASVRMLRAALGLVRRTVHVPRVTAWIAVSRFVARAYERHGVETDVLENFIDPPATTASRAFDERAGIVLVARLAPEKGVHDVLSLAAALPDVPVEIVGRGPLADEVASAADRLTNLSYAGELRGEEVLARLGAARLAVVPSRWQEPAGLVALEAMAEGTPVVAYDTGGLADYVRDADAGPVVPAREGALIDACRDLYGDRIPWSAHAAGGRRAAATTHSPERYLERLVRVYRRAIEEPRRQG